MLNCVFGGYDFDFSKLCLGRGFHCFGDLHFHVLSRCWGKANGVRSGAEVYHLIIHDSILVPGAGRDPVKLKLKHLT